jgi:hypothetical protein
MTKGRRLDAADVKARVSCVAVAHELGQTPSQRAVRAGQAMTCPHGATNHAHGDRTPSCVVHNDRWRCKGGGCNAGGDVFALWAAFAGLDVKRDFARVLEQVADFGRVSPSSSTTPRPRPVVMHRAPAKKVYAPPTANELAAPTDIWERAMRVSPRLVAWCEGRGIDGDLVAQLDLARIAHPSHLPIDWEDNRRVLLPVYDAGGVLVSLKGRCTDGGTGTRGKKELSLTGHGATSRAFACPLARLMLAGDVEALDYVRDVGVLVVEGGPDYLTAATVWGDATDSPAVLGVWNGSVSAYDSTLLERIPDGTPVTLVPHRDGAGREYMATVVSHIHQRCPVAVAPYTPDAAGGDLNDLLKHDGAAAVCRHLRTKEATWLAIQRKT